jgi:hypothetical protein
MFWKLIDNPTDNPLWNGVWVRWAYGEAHHSVLHAYLPNDYWMIRYQIFVCGQKEGWVV